MLWLLLPCLAFATVQSRDISPHDIDSRTAQYKGPHIALWDDSVKPNGLLLVSIGGTNSLPKDMRSFDEEAARLGYLAIGVDYVNGPPDGMISTGCRDSKDPRCFDQFRREVVKGDSVSPLVTVGRENSLEFRIERLAQYLARKDPHRWEKFLNADGKLDWEKVVVVGHSQGSGHAAFLAKAHALRGAVLLAGPQDSFADGRTAPWLTVPSRTPSSGFYSFLHKKDFFESDKQVAVARVLMQRPKAKPTLVPPGGCPPEGAHILMTNRDDVGDPHLSVIQPFFEDIWKFILEQEVGD